MFFNYVICYIQTQACAFSHILGSKKRVKYLWNNIWRYAAACVADFDYNMTVISSSGNSDLSFLLVDSQVY